MEAAAFAIGIIGFSVAVMALNNAKMLQVEIANLKKELKETGALKSGEGSIST